MTTAELIDKLGRVRDKIALLQEEEKGIRESLLETLKKEAQGKSYRAVLVKSMVERVDYRGLIEYLKVKPAVLNRFTRMAEVTQVRVTSLRSNRSQ